MVKISKRIIAVVACMITVMSLVGCVNWEWHGKVESDRLSTEVRCMVEVVEVVREKGKEAIYELKLKWDNPVAKYTVEDLGSFTDSVTQSVEIPESVYKKYIGDGYNAITLKLEIFAANVKWSSSKESLENDTSDNVNKTRYTYTRVYMPWDDREVTPFTDEDLEEFEKSALSNLYSRPEVLFEYDLISIW